MLQIENFGSYNIEKQEEFFKVMLGNRYKYISYYTHPILQDEGDDTLELLYDNLIHFYNPRIKEVIKSSAIHHIFMYCYNKNTATPMNIMSDFENTIHLFESGNFELMDNDLKNEIKKTIGLCLWLNTDQDEYEKLRSEAIELNYKCYSNGAFHYCQYEVIWYSFKSVHELVSELCKYGQFEFLLIDDSIDNYLLGFEIYENADSFDLMIDVNDKMQDYLKKIIDLGFNLKQM